ncbi:MAG TPA: AAA family ATPase [Pseudonocardia sp.]
MPESESTPALEQARMFVASGWRPFPCEYGGKRPAVGIKWGTATAAVPTDKTLQWWFGRDPVNVGIAAKGSNLVILDEDVLGAMENLCGDYGRPVPETYRVRTAKGWHWYFTAPSDHEIGNAPGILADYGFDVRGGRGDGGYVIAAGSLHESGHVYTAEDPEHGALELPEWLCALLIPDEDIPGSGKTDDHAPLLADRRYTMEQAQTYIRDQAIERLHAAKQGNRNNALNNAAVVVGHFVPAFFTEETAVVALADEVGELGLDPDEILPTIKSGLKKGMSQPYTRVEADPFSSASDSAGSEPDAYSKELERERIRRRVRSELDAENRPALARLSFKEFISAPAPEYLVPKMFYKDGLSVVFGAPGAAKSFLVLDVAMCLATDTPWRGRKLGRHRVHYVMAEGQATNTLRTQAWLTHHDVDEDLADGWFIPYVEPIMLTESGIADYLHDVEVDQPDMIILDTKNLMFDGKEAQGDDYGRMLRTLHRLRRVAGGAAVVLIDHSGLTDDSRTRGSNAQKGGVETEVRVTEEAGFRKAEVTRDKSGQVGTQWLYKLEQLNNIPRPPDLDPPAVCVAVDPTDLDSLAPFGGRYESWNDLSQPPVPDDIVTYRGAGASALNALARFMRYSARGSVGFSLASARKAVKEVYVDERGKPKWSDDTIERAWGALVDLGRLSISEGASSTGKSAWEARPGDPE